MGNNLRTIRYIISQINEFNLFYLKLIQLNYFIKMKFLLLVHKMGIVFYNLEIYQNKSKIYK